MFGLKPTFSSEAIRRAAGSPFVRDRKWRRSSLDELFVFQSADHDLSVVLNFLVEVAPRFRLGRTLPHHLVLGRVIQAGLAGLDLRPVNDRGLVIIVPRCSVHRMNGHRGIRRIVARCDLCFLLDTNKARDGDCVRASFSHRLFENGFWHGTVLWDVQVTRSCVDTRRHEFVFKGGRIEACLVTPQ
jgi:hypothetical protein